MGVFDRLLTWVAGDGIEPEGLPRAALQPDGPGISVTTPAQLEEALRSGNISKSGISVTPESAMRVAAVFGCVRIISSAVATLPLHIKKRIDERTREDASDNSVWKLMRRRPNRWQKPAQFRRMMQAHVLLRGNGYALKVRGALGDVVELLPLHPDRVKTKQRADLSLYHDYSRPDGRTVRFEQKEILHLYGLTLDGIIGVTPITYARETIGLSLAMDRHMSSSIKNGAAATGVMRSPKKLSDDAFNNLKQSLNEYRAEGEKAGQVMLLEEGLEYQAISMTPEDMQWIDGRKLSRSDIAMFFGVPPSMIGDNSGSDSNWGTGLEQKSSGFVTYTLEDYLTMWEESITVDLLDDDRLYARFNRAALVKGDIKARWDAYVKGLQWGVWSPNEIRALEDANPRDGGDIYYPPPNTAGKTEQEKPDDPEQP